MVLIDRRACKEDQKRKEKKKDIYGLLMLLLRHWPKMERKRKRIFMDF